MYILSWVSQIAQIIVFGVVSKNVVPSDLYFKCFSNYILATFTYLFIRWYDY